MESDADRKTNNGPEFNGKSALQVPHRCVVSFAPETQQMDHLKPVDHQRFETPTTIFSRPELAESFISKMESEKISSVYRGLLSDIDPSTSEISANSPRYRRRSSTFIDGIHDIRDDKTCSTLAPAQLYSTESGRLFHSGRIVIVLVGLPARGKTHISVSISRYLQWLGVKTRIFHLGDYRRATIGENKDVPDDYFFVNASAKSVILRQKILEKCRQDLYSWLDDENGQVAIYDAVNPHSSGRRLLAMEFAQRNVQTLFLESYVTDQRILAENARNVKINSPDFQGMDVDEAAQLYLKRIDMKIPHFETMTENELNYIKMINAGESIQYNNVSFGYLSYRIVFYLMNLHIKRRAIFFTREGTSGDEDLDKVDASLSEEGVEYSRKMTKALLTHREAERATAIAQGENTVMRTLTVWTSTRKLSLETAIPLKEQGFTVRQRSQMSQLNPGVFGSLNEITICQKYPDEAAKHDSDPYHHRYPRAESYHDLAVRLEPIILELEREENDLLIIAHESVLRVLYGYLMACDATYIPTLDFPRNRILEVIPASYQNEAKIIHIPDFTCHENPRTSKECSTPVPSISFESLPRTNATESSSQNPITQLEEHPLSLD
ncbi:putative 6-phosphofructo-2-kinase/fructose-2,6-bisphosphatase [Golovinomyces cichoracearum]|uniref:Putative 6-phosphofructo-2-kinase/fructose-2,6-bisphosphatase n=1 Tax=Golovinomyces cichoracearum TaxID=62708 RepID=A0A420J0N1_9PEZI|nr:putative 6-phosphofructo-2-kinase/fructose-2,6-bisphosphatase [Golovinomyces cichoracearum]